MPRYFFDSREADRFIRDDEGLEFADPDAAAFAAAEAAASIGRDLLPSGKAREVTIEARDEAGQAVVHVTVAMIIKRFYRT